MNVHYLEAFYHVAKQGGFSAAAEHLEVSKGLISRHVRQLESSLNTQLFYRTTRFVKLTEAGEQLYRKAEHIFLLAREAEQDILDVTEESSGILRFTSPLPIGEKVIADILPRFQQLCPQVKVILNFTSTVFNISHGEQDIALRISNNLPDDVVAKHIGIIRNIPVASPEFLHKHGILNHTPNGTLKNKPKNTLHSAQQINEYPCILFNHQRSWDTWQIYPLPYQEDGYTEITIQGSVYANQYTTARQLALLGQGIANIPLYLIDEDIKTQRLVPVLPDCVIPMHPLYIIHAAQRRVPRKIQLFKQLLAEWFTQNPEFLL